MNYNIIVLPEFATQVKKLYKKYKSIKTDLKSLTKDLQENPKLGIHLHGNCYKVRVSNSSIPTGKSGGFRIVYYFVDTDENIYLMTMYSKTQKENIDENELINILNTNGLV